MTAISALVKFPCSSPKESRNKALVNYLENFYSAEQAWFEVDNHIMQILLRCIHLNDFDINRRSCIQVFQTHITLERIQTKSNSMTFLLFELTTTFETRLIKILSLVLILNGNNACAV